MTTPLFAQSHVACLTREEECLLKTALAMVILKKRKRQEGKDLDNDGSRRTSAAGNTRANDETTSNTDTSKHSCATSLLDSLFKAKRLSPSTAAQPLLTTHNHIHLNQIFQVAKSMATNRTTSQRPNSNSPLTGTASHLAQQLQVWLQHEHQHQQELEDGQRPPQDKDDTASILAQDWIRSHLTALEESNFLVFQVIVQQATQESLTCTVLSVVVTILRELYHDRFGYKVSNTTRSHASLMSLDLLATHSLRLVHICLDWYHSHFREDIARSRSMQVLQHCLSGDAELLIPLPFSRLPRTYGQKCRHSVGLDSGAKLLLRLALYRCVLSGVPS